MYLKNRFHKMFGLRLTLVCHQMVSPTYDYSDAVLLAMLETLSSEFPKPLPPFDLTFLHEGLHRGAPMRARVVKLAARQASTAVSAKRLIENFLSAIDPGNCEVVLRSSVTQLLYKN